MDLTQGSFEEKNKRAKKMLLWFGIASLIMSFAGWTSAFVVSRTRKDWLQDYELPQAFLWSALIIIISSLTFILAKRALKSGNQKSTTVYLLVTLVLGLFFIFLQFTGFDEMIASGYNFTGPTSNITMTFIFLIAAVHIAHVVVGLISLVVVIINHLRKKYSSKNMLGLELAATFWHFIDLLWIYLFLFLFFMK
ncbi:MAG: cytochrome c oxidase subunit 3 [Bacteroidia bacterium]|nr:cytochrome c oxidase subunit 3 [Bacteroidia bacterium]NNK28191.1 heme-copper oxidase subunit III [Flavobacteriaceae bacterium]